MGLVSRATKSVIHLGGSGGWNTPTSRDIVYASPWESSNDEAGVQVTAATALTYIPFFAGVRLISEDLGSLPFGVYRDLDGGGKERRREHPLHPVIHDQANPYMTAMSFREVMQAHALTWGNGYAEIEYATDGSVMWLWPLRPDRISVHIDTASGKPFYRYQLINGETKDLPWRKVFHVHGLGFDGLVGYSIVTMARRAIGMAVAGEKFAAGYMKRGNVPPAVLQAKRSYSDEALENIRSSWDEIDHRNRVAILEEGLDFQVVGLPPKDVQFLESANHLRSLMHTLLRLPPSMMSDVERSTSWGTGIEHQALGYAKHTLRPWLVRWEQESKLRLLTGDTEHYTKFTLDALLRADSKTRWEVYRIGLGTGVYSIDDVLEMEDRNPLDGGIGKHHFVQLNTARLDQVGEMTMEERATIFGVLRRGGVVAESAEEIAGLPDMDHTGLEPVTVSQQELPVNGNGQAPE